MNWFTISKRRYLMLPESNPRQSIIRFGVYEADLATGELLKSGLKLKLQEQPFRILALLLARPGELVTREELQSSLWPDAEYGEFEQGLNTAIKKVRQALGDTADNPRFVETLPRKGYRFIAPVQGSVVPTPDPAPVPVASPKRTVWVGVAILTAVALAALAGVVFYLQRPVAGPNTFVPAFASPIPVTSIRGLERGPSFSPDGQNLAFSWDGEQHDNFDIYVKGIASEKLTRLTTDPRPEFGAAWSPDGKHIAFGRWTGVYLVPSSGGGQEVRLTDTSLATARVYHPYVSWSPDGKWLAFTDACGEGREKARGCIYVVSMQTGDRRRITSPGPDDLQDVAPSFSPDGRFLAFLRTASIARNLLYIVPMTPDCRPAGEPSQVDASSDGRALSVAWMPDSRRLVLAKPWIFGNVQGSGLWLVDPSAPAGSQSALIQSAHNTATNLAISPVTGDLAYTWNQSDLNIWQIPLDPAVHTPAGPAKSLIASTFDDLVPKYSPDGRQLVFISKRGGSEEIWVSGADGSNPMQLTKMGYAGSPSWSPDGTHIVFDSMQDGQYEVYSMLAAGGPVRRLTNNPAVDGVASYSPDGKFIYFMSTRSGKNQVWRMNPDGAAARQITRGGGYLPKPSLDGRWLYYTKGPQIWKVPSEGGEEVQVPVPDISSFLAFTVTGEALYLIPDSRNSGETWVERFDFATQTTRHLMNLDQVSAAKQKFLLSPDSHTYFAHAGITVSPDGRSLVWAQADQSGSDILLMRPQRVPDGH